MTKSDQEAIASDLPPGYVSIHPYRSAYIENWWGQCACAINSVIFLIIIVIFLRGIYRFIKKKYSPLYYWMCGKLSFIILLITLFSAFLEIKDIVKILDDGQGTVLIQAPLFFTRAMIPYLLIFCSLCITGVIMEIILYLLTYKANKENPLNSPTVESEI